MANFQSRFSVLYFIYSFDQVKIVTKFLRIVKNTLLLVYLMSLSMLNVAYIHISQKKYEIKAKKTEKLDQGKDRKKSRCLNVASYLSS